MLISSFPTQDFYTYRLSAWNSLPQDLCMVTSTSTLSSNPTTSGMYPLTNIYEAVFPTPSQSPSYHSHLPNSIWNCLIHMIIFSFILIGCHFQLDCKLHEYRSLSVMFTIPSWHLEHSTVINSINISFGISILSKSRLRASGQSEVIETRFTLLTETIKDRKNYVKHRRALKVIILYSVCSES